MRKEIDEIDLLDTILNIKKDSQTILYLKNTKEKITVKRWRLLKNGTKK